jgi:tetratricopeptide (TPR) repeat protein
VRSSEKKEMQQLLCEYLACLAIAAHEQQQFDLTITLFSDVIFIAEENKLYDIWAYALRQRGTAYLDRGELRAALIDFVAAQPDFERSVADADAARKLEMYLSPQLKGLVYLNAGRAHAHVSQDNEQLNEALRLMDEGAKAIGKDGDGGNTTISAKLDQERYHLSKGMSLIISPNSALRRPVAAREEFERAMKVSNPAFKSRHVENNIRQAESYFFEGQFPKSKHYYPDEFFTMALGHAEAALELLKEVDSDQSLTRLENLYRRLRESVYGKSEDVARFGVEIMKVRHPEIFH